MVSLRRRRLLGLCTGSMSQIEMPIPIENDTMVESPNQNINPASVHPLPAITIEHQKMISEECSESTNVSVSISVKEDADSYFPGSISVKEDANSYFPDKQANYTKQYRRKQRKDQEPSIMRGVYFKNTKWQAAIKVDKKQIHLGTVGSQEEAARLYDRAAFLCGRNPNFELSEAEKQELRKYNWEEFLAMTKSSISSKKNQRRQGTGKQKSRNSEQEGGQAAYLASNNESLDLDS